METDDLKATIDFMHRAAKRLRYWHNRVAKRAKAAGKTEPLGFEECRQAWGDIEELSRAALEPGSAEPGVIQKHREAQASMIACGIYVKNAGE